MGSGNYDGYSDYEIPVKDDYNKSDNCLRLSFEVTLSSVDSEVLAMVKSGDVLSVSAVSSKGPVVIMKESHELGTVLSAKDVALLTCINGGTEYQAMVVRINGGECVVKIQAITK